METLVTIGYIALCILFFSLAIAIHEFGHFIVALKLGLKVERFSIGFGPAIWKKTWRGVEYRFSWIPLGGYVSIPEVDPEGTKKLEGGSSTSGSPTELPPWKTVAVAFAGPAMNLVLAAVLAVILSLMPNARFGKLPLDVVRVLPDGPAEKAGVLAGDKIVAINGHAVESKYDMQTEFLLAKGRASDLQVLRGGTNVVLSVEPVYEPPLDKPMLMVELKLPADGDVTAVAWMPERSVWGQLQWDAGQMYRVLKALVTPKEMKATGKALGGPVMIAQNIYLSVRHDFADGLGFLRFLNVNLAVINLLPIPVLDGGIIMFALIALVFRRKVPEKVVSALTTGFMFLLLGLMGLLILRDSKRAWDIHEFNARVEAEADAGGDADVHETTDESAQDR